MTELSYAVIGSGTTPYTTSIRKGQILNDGSTADGYRRGVNTIVINSEEYLSSPFFKPSGIILAANQNL